MLKFCTKIPSYRFISMTRFLYLLLLFPMLVNAQDPSLNIYDEKNEESVTVFADNTALFPFTVLISIQYEGLKPTKPIAETAVVYGKAEKVVLAQFTVPKNRSWKISYNFQYMEGDIKAVHDDSYGYRLPFKAGKSYSMTQGYNGPFTHQGVNALDFTMPNGEAVVAARGGIIVKVKENSNRGCPSSKCINDSNYIRILHEDGTMAEYHHLQRNGALVNEGDSVTRGQTIGKCGDTGFVSGPHLHFIVFKTDGLKQIGIKTKFEYADGKIGLLETRKKYTAFE